MEQNFSRRKFFKTSAVGSAAFLGIPLMAGCNSPGSNLGHFLQLPVFGLEGYKASDGPAGLLFSQIGYEQGFPVRVIIRLPKKELLAGDVRCVFSFTDEDWIPHSAGWLSGLMRLV